MRKDMPSFNDDYERKKVIVTDLYNRYLDNRQIDDNVDIQLLAEKMEYLQLNKFYIAVVGNGKAGKSTLINALLGETILPCGVLQTSTSIVEIVREAFKSVEIEYADNHIEKIIDDPAAFNIDEVQVKLREVGAVHQKYRNLPTAEINRYLIEGINDYREIINRIKTSHRNLFKYESLLKEYCAEYSNLAQIPRKILLTYPLNPEFENIRIMDTPGVNAIGGLGDQTIEQLRRTHAILLVHSLNSPVEDQSFYNFFEKVIPNKNVGSVIIVMPHSNKYGPTTIQEKLYEAKQIYGDYIEENRILCIDSLDKCIENEINRIAGFNGDYEISRLVDFYNAKLESEPNEKAVWEEKKSRLVSLIRQFKEDNELNILKITSSLNHSSNFKELSLILNNLSSQSQNIQIAEILSSIRTGYDNQLQQMGEEIYLLETRLKAPQTFDSEIERYKRILDEYMAIMLTFSDDMSGKYTGKQEWKDIIEMDQNVVIGKLSQCSAIPHIRKLMSEHQDKLDEHWTTIKMQIELQYATKMKDVGEEFRLNDNITLPKVDLNAVADDAQKAAWLPKVNIEEIWTWRIWEWNKFGRKIVKTISDDDYQFNEQQYLNTFIVSSQKEVQSITTKFFSTLENMICEYNIQFKKRMESLIKQQNIYLDEIKNQKENNAENFSKIQDLLGKKKIAELEVKKIIGILGDIE